MCETEESWSGWAPSRHTGPLLPGTWASPAVGPAVSPHTRAPVLPGEGVLRPRKDRRCGCRGQEQPAGEPTRGVALWQSSHGGAVGPRRQVCMLGASMRTEPPDPAQGLTCVHGSAVCAFYCSENRVFWGQGTPVGAWGQKTGENQPGQKSVLTLGGGGPQGAAKSCPPALPQHRRPGLGATRDLQEQIPGQPAHNHSTSPRVCPTGTLGLCAAAAHRTAAPLHSCWAQAACPEPGPSP